jgi:hypothetical protein
MHPVENKPIPNPAHHTSSLIRGELRAVPRTVATALHTLASSHPSLVECPFLALGRVARLTAKALPHPIPSEMCEAQLGRTKIISSPLRN